MIDILILTATCLFVIFLTFFIHEMGHYLAARIFGERVEQVAFGHGREIWSRKRSGGTIWSIRLFPLVAHVSLGDFENQKTSGKGKSRALSRALIILGGPFSNLVTPFLMFAAFFILADQPVNVPVIAGIEIGNTAEKAGFEVGDRIVAVDGTPIKSWREMERHGYFTKGEVSYDVQRGEEIVNLKVKHSWVDYNDVEGIKRSHSRIGITLRQKPFKLSVLYSVNGTVVDKQPEKIKAALLENAGKIAVVGLNSTDKKVHKYRVLLPEHFNDHLLEEDTEGAGDKAHFYIGKFKDNQYVERGFPDGTREAAHLTWKIISGVAGIPVQVLPIDPYVMEIHARVHDEDTRIRNQIYDLIYTFAVISIFMGMINLIPLPKLDGGHLLLLISEAVTKKPLTGQQQLFVFVTVFALLYLTIFISNIDNLPHYVDSRMKKVQEFLDES